MTTEAPDEKSGSEQERTLLRRYVQEGSQEAFAALVQRHLRAVFATCLREVGDPDLAQDVTQVVFLVLARKAAGLHARTSLAGWLFQTARLASRNALRRERRRMFYEQQAARQAAQALPDRYDLWDRIEPLLNEALSALRPAEREAVLLRFFQEQSFPEVGAALGLSEDAARMRVSRALGKLRDYFGKRGVVLSVAALPDLLAQQASPTVPTTCQASVLKGLAGAAGQAPAPIASSALDRLTQGVLRSMWMRNVQMAALFAGVALIGIGGPVLVRANRSAAGKPQETSIVANSPLAGPGMAQKVTVRAEGLSVGDLLSLLSRQTGVKLRADASVADDKVIVFGPARPLGEILADLAALLNDSWQKYYQASDGTVSYALQRTMRAREYEEGLSSSLVSRMMAQLDARARHVAATSETLAHRPEEKFSDSSGRRTLALYACLSPEQRQQLFASGRLNLTFDNLTPAQQAQVRGVFDVEYAEEQAQFQRDKQSTPELLDTTSKPEDIFKGGLRLGLLLSSRQLIARIGHHYSMSLTLDDTGSPWLLPAHGNPYNGSKISSKAELPAAGMVRDAARPANWIDALQQISEAAGVPVMADYYRSRPVGSPEAEAARPATGEANASVEALDALCHPRGCLWWTRGKTLLFRKRNWYTQRLYEVPDRWIVTMNRRLKAANNQPSYADMVLLADLTPMQMRGLNGIPDRPEGSLIRPAADEYWMSGVPQLLAIVKASSKLDTGSLPYHNPRQPFPPGSMDRFALNDADCAPGLLQAFLAAQNDLLFAPDYKGFHLSMWRPLETVQTAADGYQYVPVTLSCMIENKQGMFLDFLLPASLPDDRRDQTKIAVP